LLCVALVSAAALSTAWPSPAAPVACTPGVSKVAGGFARTFCGNATARVLVKGKTHVFTGGQCDIYPRYLVVNIGTVVVGGTKKKAYFGLLLGKHPAATAVDPVVSKDGTYTKGLITIRASGIDVSVHNAPDLRISLVRKRRAGTFSGTGFGTKVTGSFRC
jgi:hypothetical protein